MTALAVRTGDGTQRALAPALIGYVWGERGLAESTRLALDDLRTWRPDAVCLHGGTTELLADLRRCVAAVRLAGDAIGWRPRIWVGIGIDGGVQAYRKGTRTAESLATRYAEVARLAGELGAEVLVPNGEGRWAEERGDVRTRGDVRALADSVGRAIRTAAPGAVLALSSFGALGYHADVRALIEGLTPHCSLFTGQSYVVVPGGAAKGALDHALARDDRSQEATVREGWIRADDREGEDSPDDLDRIPSVQAYKTPPTDLCRVASERPHLLCWSLPLLDEGGRADEAGMQALTAARVIRAEVGAGPGAVARYQRAHGLEADGSPGPVTRAHALSRAELAR